MSSMDRFPFMITQLMCTNRLSHYLMLLVRAEQDMGVNERLGGVPVEQDDAVTCASSCWTWDYHQAQAAGCVQVFGRLALTSRCFCGDPTRVRSL